MLESVRLSKKQSETRERLAVLAAVESPSDQEVEEMRSLDKSYQSTEVQYRAALTGESEEREQAKSELETRSDKEYRELLDGFELRQVAAALDDGSALEGQTREVVEEMRSHGSYQGLPIPLEALEVRAGETVAGDNPDPIQTRPIIDRLFPNSVAARMGANLINISNGLIEWPVATQGATASWADGELADVGAAVEYQTVDKAMKPNQNLGCQMILSRRTIKQSGPAVEQAIRRDMNAAIAQALDTAVFLGTGANGQPLGVIAGSATYGIDTNVIDAAADYAAFRTAGVEFMTRNAATSLKDIRLMFRHELLNTLDDTPLTGTAVTDLDRITSKFGSVVSTGHALEAPAGSPLESKALMTTNTGGVAPIFVGLWGGVDLVRDQYTKASSGQLVLTGITTVDVTVARAAQLGILEELQ